MIKYSFTKMNGAGNDFIVFNKTANPGLQLDERIIRKLCDRRFGIGSDGVITVSPSAEKDFVMEYFNADGSTGSLCGNGARCAVFFAREDGVTAKKNVDFISNGKSYSATILNDGSVKFFLQPPEKIKTGFKIKVSAQLPAAQLLTAHFADTGSPHVVVFCKDIGAEKGNGGSAFRSIDEVPVFELGREIRYLPEFMPGGVNVNFVDTEGGSLVIRTYERGVEDETCACGTGSVASAIIAHKLLGVASPVVLSTKSKKELTVGFTEESGRYTGVSLTGPAEINYSGIIEIE